MKGNGGGEPRVELQPHHDSFPAGKRSHRQGRLIKVREEPATETMGSTSLSLNLLERIHVHPVTDIIERRFFKNVQLKNCARQAAGKTPTATNSSKIALNQRLLGNINIVEPLSRFFF